MTEQIKNISFSNTSGRVVLLLVGLLTAILCWKYAIAVNNGLTLYRESEFSVIKPDFEAPNLASAVQVPNFTLKDRFNNDVTLSAFNSVDLLVINIWSSGCPVCREEVPELTEMDQKLSSLGNAALLTIAVEEGFEDVSNYFPKGTNLRILFDPDNKIAKGIFGTEKYPETFILDKQRRIVARFDGKRPWHSDTMFNYLAKFI